MISRRSFLGSGLAALATWLVSDAAAAPPGVGKWLAELEAAELTLVGFDGRALSAVGDVAAMRRALASHLKNERRGSESIETTLARVIAAEHGRGQTHDIDGWVVSETEYALLALATALHNRAGTSPRIDQASVSRAGFGTVVALAGWGPRSTCAGVAFNAQRDGHSSLWIELAEDASPGLQVVVAGELLKTAQGLRLLSTRVEGAQFDRLFAAPGQHRVEIYDPARGIRQAVGDFLVTPGCPRAQAMSGQAAARIHRVEDWGPRATPRLTPFNLQGERSSFWFRTSCAPAGLQVWLGELALDVVVAPDLVTASFAGLEPLSRAGPQPLRLVDPDNGDTVQVGEFEVSD